MWGYQRDYGAASANDYKYVSGVSRKAHSCQAKGLKKIAKAEQWGDLKGVDQILYHLQNKGPVAIGI